MRTSLFPLTRSRAFALALLLAAAPVARAQDACNAPAKDAIVHLDVPGTPFEPVITADGCWLFVTLAAGNRPDGGDIAVVRRDAGKLSVVRTVPVKGNPTGAVLTHDGKTLIVASGAYLAFLDASRLISGAGDPVLGYIGNGSPVGFIYVNVTADDKIVFAAAERAEAIVSVNMDLVRAGKITDDAVISKLDVGNAPIAVTLSPDGRYLYTTSEISLPSWKWPEVCKPENAVSSGRGRGRAPPPYHGQGAIIVFDAALAVTAPSRAAVSRVAAGCSPVRLVLSPDGNTAYVSARNDNSLLAFDAHKLVNDTAHALLGKANYRLLANTVAHQWYGVTLSPASKGDWWISDGFARYEEARYVEYAAGQTAFEDVVKDMEVGALAYDTVPLSSAGRLDTFAPEFQALTTDKGAIILNMLRWVIGDAAFDKSVQQFVKEYRGKSVTVDDLRKIAEANYGDTLTWFFAQWLDSTGAPEFKSKYTVYRVAKGFRVVGEIAQDLDLFRMPVELKIASGERAALRVWHQPQTRRT